jgi:hypothetical protein
MRSLWTEENVDGMLTANILPSALSPATVPTIDPNVDRASKLRQPILTFHDRLHPHLDRPTRGWSRPLLQDALASTRHETLTIDSSEL